MIKGEIIRQIYDKGKTNQLIEIWETTHYFDENIPFGQLQAKNMLDPTDNYWDSTSKVQYPSFVIHFKNYTVHSSKYSFRNTQKSDVYPNDWEVFGSMDNKTWTPLATVTGNKQFANQKNKTISFEMKDIPFSWFRFVFTQSTLNGFTVYIRQVEFYGTAFPYFINTISKPLIKLQIFVYSLFLLFTYFS